MATQEPVKFSPAPEPPDPDRAPKRERQPRSDTGKPRRKSRNLETRIGAFLVTTNTVLLQIPAVRADALDTAELTLLAKGISDECNRHPAFRRYVEYMLDMGASAGGLGMAVVIIASRRAARHNLIPAGVLPIPNEAVDGMLGQFAIMAARTPAETQRQAQQQPPSIAPDQNGRGADAGPLD